MTQKLYYKNKSNGGILENNTGREWVGSLKGSGVTGGPLDEGSLL